MALETLRGVKVIGGYKMYDVEEALKLGNLGDLVKYTNDHPISVNHKNNSITFKIQNGTIKEAGVNGCQVDTLIHAAMLILKGLNEKVPSAYNDNAINKLEMAIWHLEQRTKDRQERGVEGSSHE